jgi:hypothetical protein
LKKKKKKKSQKNEPVEWLKVKALSSSITKIKNKKTPNSKKGGGHGSSGRVLASVRP